MILRIPSRRANLLRNYENALFYQKSQPRHERLYAFYLLIRPLLGWLKEDLVDDGLEPDEAESELFLLSDKIFQGFNPEKSSIIPYLTRAILWKVRELQRDICQREPEQIASGLIRQEYEYKLDDEIYLDPIDILFEDRYVGKCFTRAQKYLISIILTSDDDKLGVNDIGRRIGLEFKTMKIKLSEIREILETEDIK